MSGCHCNQSTCDICGPFTEPTNPDEGSCFPYPLRRTCEAPDLAPAECDDDEYIAEYNPEDVLYPFTILARIFDQNCLPIQDQDDLDILGTLA